jgi:putative oxidoreductase
VGKNLALLIGRLLMSVIFLGAGISKIADFAAATGYMASRPAFANMESALPILAGFAVFAEVGGGLSLVLGWMTRLGAIGLVLFLIPTTFIFHNFWTYPAGAQTIQQVMFLKNIAIIGGLLVLSIAGPGAISVDGLRKKTG